MKVSRSGAQAFVILLASGWYAGIGLFADEPAIPEEVQAAVQRRVEYGYAPGIVVGVRTAAGSAYFAYGHTDRSRSQPVDHRTLFEIGSVTKVFTTTVLADMAERGELNLTNLVQQYVPPGIRVPTRQGRAMHLTHLASHTSGLPSTPNNLPSRDGNNPFAGYTQEAMFEFLNAYTLTRNPGTQYEYSNYGVGLLGTLLAGIAQTDYETLLRQRVTTVLDLPDTGIQLTEEQRTRLAHGHSGVVPIPEFEMTALEGAGALRSTASDLMDFLAANRGWIASPLYTAMTNAHRFRTPTVTPGLSVGLGWHILALTSGTALWHDGATIGHRAFIGFLEDGPTLTVALANSDFATMDLGLHLLDPRSPLAPLRKPAVLPEETLRHYVGRYQRSANDQFTISLSEGHLVLQYAADLGRALTLYPTSPNRFYLTFPEAHGTFTTNAAGQATALAWTQSGRTTHYPKVRQPARLVSKRTPHGFEFHIQGDTDREYVIEASADLRQWWALSTNSIWQNPVLDIPATATVSPRQFFRARER